MVSGGGTVGFFSDEKTVSGSYNLSRATGTTHVSTGTVRFTATAVVGDIGELLRLDDGTLDFGGRTISVSRVQMGFHLISGPLTVTNTFDWRGGGGTISGTGAVTIYPGRCHAEHQRQCTRWPHAEERGHGECPVGV